MIKLTKKEQRLLYNFAVGESNRIYHPNINGVRDTVNALSIEIRFKPSTTNLNNFDGDVEKYKKALKRLIKKLDAE